MTNSNKTTVSAVCNKWLCATLLLFCLVCSFASLSAQSSYPVHATVQVVPPYGVYLNDYVSGSRDRLVVTLLNRDHAQPFLEVRLQMRVRNSGGFQIQSRPEIPFPVLSLESGIPLRLTSGDLQPYFAAENTTVQGSLRQGQLPPGMTEFSFRVVEAHTGLPLSAFATGRVWIEIKKPPLLNLPLQGEQIAWREPQHIRFQWQPQHQGLAGTVYEFVLKELPDNGVAPQSAFAYGQEIFRTETPQTTLNYTHLDQLLIPGRRYGWQVRAIAKDGIDEIGMFENHGYSEIRWFEANENCPPPAAITAQISYRKINLRWQSMPKQQVYTVEYRPKSARELYEWTSISTPQSEINLTDLRPGWTYEYRVGAFCTTDKPVYSAVGEATLSLDDESLTANCGMTPTVNLSNQNPAENLNAGDVVTIGGDFPMTLTQVSPQGNGWFSGKGWVTMPWLKSKVLVKFSRLRVNSDNKQLDGEVETETDPNASQIANLNELDYGGGRTTPSKIIFTETKVDFVIPPLPEAEYNPEKEELLIYDAGGQPRAVQIPRKGEGESAFPMIVTDKDGNKYKVELPEDDMAQNDTDAAPDKDKNKTVKPVVTKIETLPPSSLADKLDPNSGITVRFTRGAGKYALDEAAESWYSRSVMLREYYAPVGSGYIAPWKLVPEGESDAVEAYITATKGYDKTKLRFALQDGMPVTAKETDGKWTLTLPGVKHGETYDVFALYQTAKNKYATVGKLRVVSYRKQQHTVTMVEVNGQMPNVQTFEQQLNAIYAPYGITITVKTDSRLNNTWQTTETTKNTNELFKKIKIDYLKERS